MAEKNQKTRKNLKGKYQQHSNTNDRMAWPFPKKVGQIQRRFRESIVEQGTWENSYEKRKWELFTST